MGYSKAETFDIIWSSKIPLDNSLKCKEEVQKVVNSARKKAAYHLVADFLKDFPLTGYLISEDDED